MDSLTIQTLAPATQEARLLINWVERGVFDALQKEFLESVTFDVHSVGPDNDRGELQESYCFAISYLEPSFGETIPDSQSSQLSQPQSSQQLRSGTASLLQNLRRKAEALPPLPQKRLLSFRLVYRDGFVSSEYQPLFFVNSGPKDDPADDPTHTHWTSESITTVHHALTVLVARRGMASRTFIPHPKNLGLETLLPEEAEERCQSPQTQRRSSRLHPEEDDEQRPARARRPPVRYGYDDDDDDEGRG